MGIKETRVGGCGLDSSGQSMDSWRVLVNTAMNLWTHKSVGNVLAR